MAKKCNNRNAIVYFWWFIYKLIDGLVWYLWEFAFFVHEMSTLLVSTLFLCMKCLHIWCPLYFCAPNVCTFCVYFIFVHQMFFMSTLFLCTKCLHFLCLIYFCAPNVCTFGVHFIFVHKMFILFLCIVSVTGKSSMDFHSSMNRKPEGREKSCVAAPLRVFFLILHFQ